MINTSQSFYDNAVFKYRTTKTQINVNVFDYTAKEDIISVESENYKKFVPVQIYDDIYFNQVWATLEENEFFLDGSITLLPENLTNEQIGWWTELANDNGEFETNPLISIELDNNHSTVGLTIHYDKFSYPVNSKISWYSGDLMLDTITIENQSISNLTVQRPVDGYNKITIEILKAKPNCYVRLSEVDYGITTIFDSEQLQGAKMTEQASLLSNTLSPNQLSFSVIDYDNRYNVFNPSDLFKYFKVGQPCIVRSGILNRQTNEFEYISMGEYYINNFEIDNGILKINAYGLLDILNSEMYYSQFFTNQTAENILRDILGSRPYYINSNVKDITLTGYIPLGTKKEALKNLAIACGAVVKEGRDGKIYFYRNTEDLSTNQLITENTIYKKFGYSGLMTSGLVPLENKIEAVPYVFTVDRNTRMSEIKSSMIGYYNEVDVTYKNYLQGTSEQLFNDIVITDINGIGIIKYNGPVTVTSVSISGATYNNYADCTVIVGEPETEYQTTVTGKKYNINEYTLKCVSSIPTKDFADTVLTMQLNKCNELVTSAARARDIGFWYLGQLERRKDVQFDWWAVPTAEETDYIKVITNFRDSFELEIEQIDYNLYDLTARVKGIA